MKRWVRSDEGQVHEERRIFVRFNLFHRFFRDGVRVVTRGVDVRHILISLYLVSNIGQHEFI